MDHVVVWITEWGTLKRTICILDHRVAMIQKHILLCFTSNTLIELCNPFRKLVWLQFPSFSSSFLLSSTPLTSADLLVSVLAPDDESKSSDCCYLFFNQSWQAYDCCPCHWDGEHRSIYWSFASQVNQFMKLCLRLLWVPWSLQHHVLLCQQWTSGLYRWNQYIPTKLPNLIWCFLLAQVVFS